MCVSLRTLLFTQLIALKDKRICQYSTVEALITSLGFSGPHIIRSLFGGPKQLVSHSLQTKVTTRTSLLELFFTISKLQCLA